MLSDLKVRRTPALLALAKLLCSNILLCSVSSSVTKKLTSRLSTGCDTQRLLAAALVSAHVIQAFAVQQQHILYLYNINCYRQNNASG